MYVHWDSYRITRKFGTEIGVPPSSTLQSGDTGRFWNWNFSGGFRQFSALEFVSMLSGPEIFISLHIRSMWETICDALAGFWLNSKFLSKFSRKPLSGISYQKAPPMENFRFEMTKVNSEIPPQWKTSDLRWPKLTPKYPPNGKLQIWDDQSLLQNTPPHPMENFRFGMTKVYSKIPPPMENFRFEMTKVYSKIPPSGISDQKAPPPWKTSDLRWPKFTPKYPPFLEFQTRKPSPQNEKLQIWDDQSLLWNTPPWKTSDLRWQKFTSEYPPVENFRFGMTKVYSEIPPPPMENFRFEMTKVYSEIPPPPPHPQAWNPGDRMWRLTCIPRGYHSFIAIGTVAQLCKDCVIRWIYLRM